MTVAQAATRIGEKSAEKNDPSGAARAVAGDPSFFVPLAMMRGRSRRR
jgi:hypothetical protein